ncbi:trypsin-like peptidase domain-containing protein [Candidatus Saccharibacteria bacterium]|nr:trypsin-like peptidase domain-containing protein [Candidatus Saccharibacteria bacterium]
MEDRIPTQQDQQATTPPADAPLPAQAPVRNAPPADNRPPASQPHRLPTGALIAGCFLVSMLGSGLVIAGSRALDEDAAPPSVSETKQVVSSEGELVADIAKKVGASTVSITTQSLSAQDYFGQASVQEGAGTGIILTKDGYIMTNRHVIPEGTQNVSVTMSDGTQFDNVTVVGRDRLNDIAFLKINDPGRDLPVATIGDSSKVQVGQKVVAVGNALGQFQNTVTTGVISGLGRPVTAGDESGGGTELLSNLFQTDAAINPGNSGGPLVNMAGEVIGMNTAVASDAQGIGFAIPVNDAKGLIKSVSEQGRLIRPFLGVRTIPLTPVTAKQLNLSVSSGAYVTTENGVVGGSPAEQAGIRGGDVITKIDGQAIDANNPVSSLVARHGVGDEIAITVLRDGKEETLKATLAEAEQ